MLTDFMQHYPWGGQNLIDPYGFTTVTVAVALIAAFDSPFFGKSHKGGGR